MFYVISAVIGLLMLAAAFAFRRLSSKRALSSLKVGDLAPDFELKNYQGTAFKLSSYRDKKPVVLFFYPSDNTPGCTTEVSPRCFCLAFVPHPLQPAAVRPLQQACTFQRLSPDFAKLGAEVFGISGQGTAEKEKFIVNNKLTAIELLIDEGNKVRKAFGVPKALLGMIPGRVTYVINKEGKVVCVFDDLFHAAMHPEKALEALDEAK